MSELGPEAFLYQRQGPWPQPSPSHPLGEAPEVLNIPRTEKLAWDATIGLRYAAQMLEWPLSMGEALLQARYEGPDDATFNGYLFDTCYTRYLQPVDAAGVATWRQRLGSAFPTGTSKLWWMNFAAMKLVEPIPGTYCAATELLIVEATDGSRLCVAITVNDVTVQPANSAWMLAKIYALQGAAYHMLFVTHPALHFPMDSVNAITKTAIPVTHPVFKLIFPHTTYTLELDNAVQEGSGSVVNDDAQGTWFDPLTGNAPNLKLLFAAGYHGLPEKDFGTGYARYDYLKPQMGFDSPYGQWLEAYYTGAFLPFATTVAAKIQPHDTYVKRWARYLHSYLYGFPSDKEIFEPGVLARVLAIYMWDVTVSHGGDHYSFGTKVTAPDKFLRIRMPPPTSPDVPAVPAYQVANTDDLARAYQSNRMFFSPYAITPNLSETMYQFAEPDLQQAAAKFQQDLAAVAATFGSGFMPFTTPSKSCYARTIPASIQY